ncbi:NlpC/P60 family protein [Nocardia macrotermitis]|uniref:NlpC/P60 domain-containing protein n=1 Tax=Nocardia macrotermitis TaxID=2585198 RepID=A0A7K0DCX7_9NOCA|nr:NlpC/P60 family protein [Nocardia macrotermitis]MQY23645.1 hypothetical protein [Nocardia macrotermitis]
MPAQWVQSRPVGQGNNNNSSNTSDPLSQLEPAAMMAATMLPMIASALSGLGGSKGSGTSGSGSSGAAGGSSGSGLSQEAQDAQNALNQLNDVYGNGQTSTPQTGSVQNQVDGNGSGSGMSALDRRQKYQQNAGTAYNNLDTELVSYIKYLAGNHSVDRDAITKLVNDTNSQLVQLGSAAYTREGEIKVHQILISALSNALKIVGNSNANANAVAVEINRLTDQYLYNLIGVNYPAAKGESYSASAAAGSSSAAQKAISVALSEQGTPYVYGAEGPNAFDCSGLTQYSAAAAGARIPRTAAQQYQQLPKVNPSDIQPGDLIFPAAEFNNGSPGHVMMYIGNGKCVEAPHTGATVRVVNLPSSYAASRWT